MRPNYVGRSLHPKSREKGATTTLATIPTSGFRHAACRGALSMLLPGDYHRTTHPARHGFATAQVYPMRVLAAEFFAPADLRGHVKLIIPARAVECFSTRPAPHADHKPILVSPGQIQQSQHSTALDFAGFCVSGLFFHRFFC